MTIPIAMLGEKYQKSMYKSMSLHEKQGDPKLFIVNVGLTYVKTGKEYISVYTPFSYGLSFLDWKGKDVRSLYEKYKNTVDAMAGGNAKDLVAAIKRNF
jgi:hypothetical protein